MSPKAYKPVVKKVKSAKIDDVHLMMVCTSTKVWEADADRYEETPRCRVEAKYDNARYLYDARNIFDFGLAINPVGGKAAGGHKGGIPMDVPSFVRNNLSNTGFFKHTEAERDAFRREHPTSTGLGWDRAFINRKRGGPRWVPMDKKEAHVYRIVDKSLPKIMREMRM